MPSRLPLVSLISIGVLVCSSLGRAAPVPRLRLRVPRGFDLAGAMKSIYGNYNPIANSSTALTPEGAADESSFFTGKQVTVRPFFATTVEEGGQRKVFLLTYATPLGQGDFDCHACAPLLGAFAFSAEKSGWTLTASSKAATIFGQWGHPADASLIRIGPDRHGVKLEETVSGQGENTVIMAMLVPWDKAFETALQAWIGDDDSGTCGPGGDFPCYANRKKLKFVKGGNPDYFDIVLTLNGTDVTETGPFRIRRVSGVERLRFTHGKYFRLFRTGDVPTFEQER